MGLSNSSKMNTLPVVRHVVDMSKDHSEQLLGAEHHVLIWDEGPAHSHRDSQKCDSGEDVFHS